MLTRWIKVLFCVLWLMFAVVLPLSCSRKAAEESITISIPVSGSSENSSFSADEKLGFVVINIKMPNGSQIVKQYEFHDNPISAGQPIEFTINNIPAGVGFLVQYLGVWESDTSGTMRFSYGDTNVNVSGRTVADITASFIGSSTKQAQISGRYFTGANTGPTGNLVMTFQPPGDKPAMSIEKTPIINGWFNVFALDGTDAAFDYTLEDTGEVIFDNLHFNSSIITTSTSVLAVDVPTTYRKEGDGGIRARPQSRLVLGFFGNITLIAGREVCYPTVHEAIPGMFLDANLANPLEYSNSGVGGLTIANPTGGGGTGYGFVDIYGNSVCVTDESAGELVFYHHKIGDDRDGYSGIRPPFRLIRPFQFHGGYLATEFISAPALKLDWALLQGAATVLGGYEIWAKYSGSSSFEGGDHDRTCDDLSAEGYSFVTDINTPATTTYNFTGVGGTSVNSSNYYGFRVAICPYRNVASSKEYIGRYVENDCTGNCGDLEHFGWAKTGDDYTASTGGFAANGGAFARIVGPVTSNAYYTQFPKSGGGFTAGDEVFIHVVGNGTTGDCGTYNGQVIQPGTYTFTRLLYASANFNIPRGTFLDGLDGTYINGTTTSANFCYVQVVKVPHYRNLTVSPAGQIQGTAFDYDSTATGGVIAYRVNGSLNFGAAAAIGGAGGHSAGDSTTQHGGGQLYSRNNGTANNNNMGGQASTTSSGGAGYGSGGRSANAPGGASFNGNSGMVRLMMGGGGGSVSPDNGGAGGGIVFIMANEINSSSGVIDASGSMGSGTGTGGGGGGSVVVLTKKLTGSGLSISANGGAGASPGGGNGGGGYQYVGYCSNPSSTPLTISTTAGSGGYSGAGPGSLASGGNGITPADISTMYMCY